MNKGDIISKFIRTPLVTLMSFCYNMFIGEFVDCNEEAFTDFLNEQLEYIPIYLLGFDPETNKYYKANINCIQQLHNKQVIDESRTGFIELTCFDGGMALNVDEHGYSINGINMECSRLISSTKNAWNEYDGSMNLIKTISPFDICTLFNVESIMEWFTTLIKEKYCLRNPYIPVWASSNTTILAHEDIIAIEVTLSMFANVIINDMYIPTTKDSEGRPTNHILKVTPFLCYDTMRLEHKDEYALESRGYNPHDFVKIQFVDDDCFTIGFKELAILHYY